jgi:hypothetical protein
MASSSSFIYFFPATAQDPQSCALFRLPCITRNSFRNVIPESMNVLYSDSKTDLKVRAKTLLLHWQLYVACYYPTTPTDYPNTTTGTSVCPSVAVNIEFCGYLWFFSITSVWIIWVQYATDNLSGQKRVFASWASVDISTHSELQSKR